MAARFYVAQTNPSEERLARTELAIVSIKTIHLTRIYETAPDYVRPWRGGAQREAPLFPGYLLLELDLADPAQHWRKAASRRGIHRLLGRSPEAPEPVPVGVVEELYQRWQDGAFDERRHRRALPRVQVGQAGCLLVGRFADQVGECVYSSAKRVELLIGLLRVSGPPAEFAVAV